MASTTISLCQTPNFLTCTLCTKPFTEPKLLPCLHTYCLSCLTAAINHDRPECPDCHEAIALPVPGGLPAIPSNTFIKRLVEVQKMREVNEGTHCTACTRTGAPVQPPAVYCIECDDKLCASCKLAHKKFKVTENHCLVDINDHFAENLTSALRDRPTVCTEHPNQPCVLYCRDVECQVPICMLCALLKHKSHCHEDMTEISASLKTELNSAAETLSAVVDQYKAQTKVAMKCKNALNKNTREIESVVRQQAAALRAVIDMSEKQMLLSVANFRTEQEKKVQSTLAALNMKKSALTSFRFMCRNMVENASALELCRMTDQYVARSKELAVQIEFEPPSLMKLLFTSSAMGVELVGQTPQTFGSLAVSAYDIAEILAQGDQPEIRLETSDTSAKPGKKTTGVIKPVVATPSAISKPGIEPALSKKAKKAAKATAMAQVPIAQSKVSSAAQGSGQGKQPASTEPEKKLAVSKKAAKAPAMAQAASAQSKVGSAAQTGGQDKVPSQNLTSQSLSLLGSISNKIPVSGMALLGDHLYVYSRGTPQCLFVYDKVSLQQVGAVPMLFLADTELSDMAGCSANKQLYAVTKAKGEVVCIDIEGAKSQTTQPFISFKCPNFISVKSPGTPSGVSITLVLSVLVSCPAEQNLVELAVNLQLLRVIPVPGYSPFHAIQFADNRYVVCQSIGTDRKKMKLVVVDAMNQSHTVCTELSAPNLTLNRPEHLAIDSRTIGGRVFIADVHGHRVLIIDPERLSQPVKAELKVKGLLKLCIDPDASHLYVGIYDVGCQTAGSVIMYDIQASL